MFAIQYLFFGRFVYELETGFEPGEELDEYVASLNGQFAINPDERKLR